MLHAWTRVSCSGVGVAFSGLFGKKKSKDSEPRDRASSDPARSASSDRKSNSSSLSSPTRRGPATKAPPAMSPREVARATAEKIDFIESQIESEIMQSRSDYTAGRVSVTQPGGARVSGKTGPGTTSINTSTDLMLGDSHLAHSMVLADTGNPILEEAAILYANGQDLPAVSVLAAAVRDDRSPDTWQMLLELYQSLGKRVEFENLAIDFAVRFETSAPAWSETQTRKPVTRAVPAVRAAIVFKGALDVRIIPQLEELKKLAQRNPVLHLEFDQVTSVDAAGADLILRVFAAFQKSNHEVAISGAGHLADRLREAIEVGRRNSSNVIWMLLLEIYRILGRQAAFEETSIDYCVTFEVSPPSWEPASPKYIIVDQVAAPSPAEEAVPDGGYEMLKADHIALSGELVGKSEGELQRLTQFATDHEHVVVDCSRLVRVDFTAAGLLLNWAVGMRGQRKLVEFVNVGHLVAALFVVMGLHEVVPIERRKV
jgi:ABC-type transporter Mla MlaB component